jgi:uncharacterized membrane protein YgcG
MPTFLTLMFVIVIIVFVLSLATKSGQKRKPVRRRVKTVNYEQEQLPIGLGFRQELDMQALEQRMDTGLEPAFLERLKQRVMNENPSINSAEYEWKLIELKRYLAMNAIMRQVPMFSEAVDKIWHEMLMYTREYQRLGEIISGAMIHHAPYSQSQPLPDERAWFDWIYGHLFEFTPFSNAIWNSFYKYPLNQERLDQLRTLSEQEITERWFNVRAAELYPEIKQAILWLIEQAKAQINQASLADDGFNRWSPAHPMNAMGYAAGAMIFFSLADSNGFAGSMDAILPNDFQRRQDGSGSGCSACGTGNSADGNNGSSCSSGNDSGGSSCSSGSSDGGGSSSGCSSSSCGGGGGGD